MDPNIQKYHETYFELFSSDGWKQFTDELQDTFDAYRIEEIKDGNHLSEIKGERRILQRLLNFENGIRNNYDALESVDD